MKESHFETSLPPETEQNSLKHNRSAAPGRFRRTFSNGYHSAPNLLSPRRLTVESPKKNKGKKLLYFFLFLSIVLIGNWLINQFGLARWPDQASEYDSRTLRPKKAWFFGSVKNFIFDSGNLLEGQNNDRINILLLGIGGAGHEGAFLSDTNIILSIKPSTKQVALVSIPRDLSIKIEDQGYRKINYANAFGEAKEAGGGGDYARRVFSEAFGLNIPYYVRVDFTAFVELIDEVGGVTINVPRSFTDYQYPGPNYSYRTVSFAAGEQVMDGERALIYTRSRHGSNNEGSDFARARRQQQVLEALKAKLLSAGTYLNPIRIQNILSSLQAHVHTNLDFGQMMYLASLGRDTEGGIINLVIDSGPSGFLTSSVAPSGAYVLIPRAGNFTTINAAIKKVFEPGAVSSTPQYDSVIATPVPDSSFPQVRVEVQNGTWQVGLAARIKKKLEDQGFAVTTVGNTPERPVTTTAVYAVSSDIAPSVVEMAAKIVPAPSRPLPHPTTTATVDSVSSSARLKFQTNTDILIVLGTDFLSASSSTVTSTP